MPSHVLICIISGRVSIVHIFIPMRVSSFWKNIVNVQIWKPNMFLLLYIYFFPMRILNPNTKIKKEEPEAWMNICQLLFSYLMKIQWYKISLYCRKYMLTKKNGLKHHTINHHHNCDFCTHPFLAVKLNQRIMLHPCTCPRHTTEKNHSKYIIVADLSLDLS